MFCEQCGEKFGENSKFCGTCGSPRINVDEAPEVWVSAGSKPDMFQQRLEIKASQYSSNTQVTDVPEEYLDKSRFSELEGWSKGFLEQTLPFGFQLEGFVNAEVGAIWFSTHPIYSCKSCHDQTTNKFQQVNCHDCGRTVSNFCSAPIGKGDGTYPVYQVETAKGSGFIALLATEAGEDGQGAINNLLSKVLVQDFDAVATREAVAKVPATLLMSEPEYVVMKIGSIQITPQDLSNSAFNFPGLSQLLVSGPRTREQLDCAEVRIGWDPGEFEVLAVTRGSTIREVKSALNPTGGEVAFFERPEILALFLVRSDEVSTLFPPYKKIRTAEEIGIFDRSDKWIELTRPLHGYIFAIWANWEILNYGLRGLTEAEWTLASVYQLMTMEGYLHQIWTLMQTRPDTLHHQLSQLGALRPGFEEIVGYSTEPGSSVTRSDLREWFLQENATSFNNLSNNK